MLQNYLRDQLNIQAKQQTVGKLRNEESDIFDPLFLKYPRLLRQLLSVSANFLLVGVEATSGATHDSWC